MFQLDRILPFSRHLQRILHCEPRLAAQLETQAQTPVCAAELSTWLAAQTLDETTLKTVLRQFKRYAFARIAARDLADLAALDEVTAAMSTVAELTVAAALRILGATLERRHGAPCNADGIRQELIVIGMGKLGGRELNVSSDIDLIFVYPEDGETDGAQPISNQEFFTRLGRQLINAIADITADGQVFRVDMRLRPNGDSGPLVASFDMLENYFIVQGREWERYAWIKARPLTGSRHDELEAIRRPFVFRKYLDYGSINAMRELHAQIRREVERKDKANNIKLGPGGIREIEFIAQVFQLIRGGRTRALQIKPTCAVLAELGARGLLAPGIVAELQHAYVFLRRIEHRLQYVEDAQTHDLPANAEDQTLLAQSLGFADYAALCDEIQKQRLIVSRQFIAVFADPNVERHPLQDIWLQNDEPEALRQKLAALGYRDAAQALERLQAFRRSARYRNLPDASRSRIDTLIPQWLDAAAHSAKLSAEPDATLARGLDLFEVISRRAAYLALLQQYPQALAKIAQVIGSSSWAAQYLTQHPVLLDELIDQRLLVMPLDWQEFHNQLAHALDELEPDGERQMDLMREAHHAQVFRVLAQDLSGLVSLEKLSDHLSDLADILLAEALRLVWKKLPAHHRDAPRFAVISYGKLGGKELGYASDLDLVFLFEDDDANAAEIYSRLATRLNNWLSARTPAGQLFDTDLRLRPNGDSGLAVSSVAAFRQYQFEAAWMWEHQALTRARFSAGDATIGKEFEQIRIDILRQKRDLAKLRDEVLGMRRKMLDAHASKALGAEIFDLKHDPGGLIDVEFIVQYLILAHAHRHPELTGNLGNIALLKIAAELGLIPGDLAEPVRDAYREFRRRQHALRLNGARPRVPPGEIAAQRAAVRSLWKYVFE